MTWVGVLADLSPFAAVALLVALMFLTARAGLRVSQWWTSRR